MLLSLLSFIFSSLFFFLKLIKDIFLLSSSFFLKLEKGSSSLSSSFSLFLFNLSKGFSSSFSSLLSLSLTISSTSSTTTLLCLGLLPQLPLFFPIIILLLVLLPLLLGNLILILNLFPILKSISSSPYNTLFKSGFLFLAFKISWSSSSPKPKLFPTFSTFSSSFSNINGFLNKLSLFSDLYNLLSYNLILSEICSLKNSFHLSFKYFSMDLIAQLTLESFLFSSLSLETFSYNSFSSIP